MAYRVLISAAAANRLASSVDYISNVLGNSSAGTKLADSFDFVVNSLENELSFHRLDPMLTERFKTHIYRKRIANYSIFYWMDEEAHIIGIFSFLHQRQDLGSHLMADFDESSLA